METDKLFYIDCYLAGRKYHDADEAWEFLRVGTELKLVRDADNRYDKNAIAVVFSHKDRDYVLGYIPSASNASFAPLLDMGWGHIFECRISRINPEAYYERQIALTIRIKRNREASPEIMPIKEEVQQFKPTIAHPDDPNAEYEDPRVSFATRLLLLLNESKSNDLDNIFISPGRLQSLLALLSNWMTRDNYYLVRKALGCDEFDGTEMKNLFCDRTILIENASVSDEKDGVIPTISLSTILWHSKDECPKNSGISKVISSFNVEYKPVDFDKKEDVVNSISEEIEKASRGLLKNIIVPVQDDTKMILTDVLYFKALWEKEFDAYRTCEVEFFGKGGSSNVQMMCNTGVYTYFENEIFQSIMIPYLCEAEDRGYYMTVHLPKEGYSIDDVLHYLEDGMPIYSEKYVRLHLPKIDITSKCDFKTVLSVLGLSVVLDCNDLIPNLLPDITIEDVMQWGRIIVDEKKTEAAVATMFIGGAGCCPIERTPIEMNVNHEFIFQIEEETYGVILFSGIINKL